MEQKTREVYKENFTEYLLCLALDVGEGMLKNGGEISRVEDTIERICYAYGAAHVEVFTIVSFINASIRMPDGTYSSQMRRVKSTGMNLNTLEELNALSRYVCEKKPPLSEFDEKYKEAKRLRPYPRYVKMLAYGVAAGSFALFFGGTLIDGLIAFLAGIVMYFIDSIQIKHINGIAKVVISSFAASGIAGISCLLGIGDNGAMIIIGSIMLLVPGVTIGIAMRDILCGDTLAGMLKLLQACLCALMVAFGYFLAASIIGGGVI
jgi:uncharacterized membrane protein YjjP (DUF1212 family)